MIKLLKTNMGVAKAIFYPYKKTVPQHNMKASVFHMDISLHTALSDTFQVINIGFSSWTL